MLAVTALFQDIESNFIAFLGQVILKVLEWPGLLFIGVVLLVRTFREAIAERLRRGGVTVTWGEKTIALTELPNKLEMDFGELTDTIEDLRERIARLETPAGEEEPELETRAAGGAAADDKLRDALRSGEYHWRTLRRLASISGLTETDVVARLNAMGGVVLGTGKAGRIARLE